MILLFLSLTPSSSPLSLFSWSYHAVGSFLSLRGASSFPSRCLCLLFLHRLQDTMMMRRKTTAVIPPPMANARSKSSEKEAGGEKETEECRLSVLVPVVQKHILIFRHRQNQVWRSTGFSSSANMRFTFVVLREMFQQLLEGLP